MLAKELHKGDVVHYLYHVPSSGNTYEVPIRIESVDENERHVECHTLPCVTPSFCGGMLDNVYPIKITEDILKQNNFSAFHSDPKMYYLRDNDNLFDLQFGIYDNCTVLEYEASCHNGLNRIHLMNINYVHELQHVLRVLHLDDIADNFKVLMDWKS